MPLAKNYQSNPEKIDFNKCSLQELQSKEFLATVKRNPSNLLKTQGYLDRLADSSEELANTIFADEKLCARLSPFYYETFIDCVVTDARRSGLQGPLAIALLQAMSGDLNLFRRLTLENQKRLIAFLENHKGVGNRTPESASTWHIKVPTWLLTHLKNYSSFTIEHIFYAHGKTKIEWKDFAKRQIKALPQESTFQHPISFFFEFNNQSLHELLDKSITPDVFIRFCLLYVLASRGENMNDQLSTIARELKFTQVPSTLQAFKIKIEEEYWKLGLAYIQSMCDQALQANNVEGIKKLLINHPEYFRDIKERVVNHYAQQCETLHPELTKGNFSADIKDKFFHILFEYQQIQALIAGPGLLMQEQSIIEIQEIVTKMITLGETSLLPRYSIHTLSCNLENLNKIFQAYACYGQPREFYALLATCSGEQSFVDPATNLQAFDEEHLIKCFLAYLDKQLHAYASNPHQLDAKSTFENLYVLYESLGQKEYLKDQIQQVYDTLAESGDHYQWWASRQYTRIHQYFPESEHPHFESKKPAAQSPIAKALAASIQAMLSGHVVAAIEPARQPPQDTRSTARRLADFAAKLAPSSLISYYSSTNTEQPDTAVHANAKQSLRH